MLTGLLDASGTAAARFVLAVCTKYAKAYDWTATRLTSRSTTRSGRAIACTPTGRSDGTSTEPLVTALFSPPNARRSERTVVSAHACRCAAVVSPPQPRIRASNGLSTPERSMPSRTSSACARNPSLVSRIASHAAVSSVVSVLRPSDSALVSKPLISASVALCAASSWPRNSAVYIRVSSRSSCGWSAGQRAVLLARVRP